MQNISKHISYKEAVRSNTARRLGIDNAPNEKQLERMRYVADVCFEPARDKVDARIFIHSFYRNPLVNKKIGGSIRSFHPYGGAIDADAEPYDETTNRELFLAVIDNSQFTELIYEYPTDDLGDCDWVHMACVKGRENERRIKIKYSGKKYRLMTKAELEQIRNYKN